jgi:hypothetical protein
MVPLLLNGSTLGGDLSVMKMPAGVAHLTRPEWYGEAHPIADNATATRPRRNRRIDINDTEK